MFEPKDYHSKRAALNEIALQQILNIVYRSGDQATKSQIEVLAQQFGEGQQRLRDEEANRVLGKFVPVEGVEYADGQTVLEYLKANVGRTYFGTEEHTSAPQGSIGTAEFGKKFAEWLNSLPEYDASVSVNLQTGFYADTMTVSGQKIPLVVLRYGDEIITIVFRRYVSLVVLNVAHIPADYSWDRPHHYALRGEMYSYRNNLSVADLESLLALALSAHTNLPLNKPTPPAVSEELVTTGYSQVVDAEAEFAAQVTTDGSVTTAPVDEEVSTEAANTTAADEELGVAGTPQQ